MKLRLDYDKYTFRFTDTLYMLKSIPLPYNVRVSASGEGLHIIKDGDYTYDDPLYITYDDPRRLRMNRIRQRNGVSHNFLWSMKPFKRNKREAGKLHRIETITDILAFMTHLYDITEQNRKSYIPLPLSKLAGVNQK